MAKSRIVKIPDEPEGWIYSPEDGLPYRRYRALIRDECARRCAYCLTRESLYPAGERAFQLDHYRPKAKYPELARRYRNLRWSCSECNRLKGTHPFRYSVQRGLHRIPKAQWLPDIMSDRLRDHFVYRATSGLFEAVSARGEEAIRRLNLNAQYRVQFRLDLEAAVDLLHSKLKQVKRLVDEKKADGVVIPDEIKALRKELRKSYDRMTKDRRTHDAVLEP